MTNYIQQLTVVQRSFYELSELSNKRLRDLETLLDFIQSTTTELIWLNEKEEIETSRDWSSKSLDVAETERYHEVSCSFTRTWHPSVTLSEHFGAPVLMFLFLSRC